MFFFVSGLLAASAVARPWRDLTARRIALYLWVYWLWWTIAFAFDAVMPATKNPQVTDPRLWLRGFVVPNNDIWYLFALAVFVVLTKLTLRIPTALLLAVAGLVAVPVGASMLTTTSWVGDYMLMYAVFFLLGVRISSVARNLTARIPARPKVAVVVAVAYAALVWATVAGNLLTIPFARLSFSVIGVCVGVYVSIAWSVLRPLRWLAAVGRQTLPVYVTHQVIMAAAALALALAASPPARSVITIVGPVVLTAVALPVSVALGRALSRVPGVFSPPAWVSDHLSSALSPTSAPPAAVTPARRGTRSVGGEHGDRDRLERQRVGHPAGDAGEHECGARSSAADFHGDVGTTPVKPGRS